MNNEIIKAAREALDNLDDYARMEGCVDAVGPRGVLEAFITLAERATPAAASAGEAGTIDTPEFRALCVQFKYDVINEDPTASLIAHINQHVAAAEKRGAEAERVRLVQTIKNANDIAAEAIRQRDELRAATAPVSAVPAAGDVKRDADHALEILADVAHENGKDRAWINEQLSAIRAAFARAALLPSAGAPKGTVTDYGTPVDNSAGAPVSAADLPAWKIGFEANPNAGPAGGQELPALTRYGFDGTLGGDFGEEPDGPYVRLDDVQALLAMRQPQGDELADVRALIASDSYAISFQSFGQYRSALLKFIAAKQAGKEAS